MSRRDMENAAGNPNSLICPRCRKLTRQEVVDSRPAADHVRRRRACPCGHRFTTRERIVTGGGVVRQIEFWAKTRHQKMAWEDPVL